MKQQNLTFFISRLHTRNALFALFVLFLTPSFSQKNIEKVIQHLRDSEYSFPDKTYLEADSLIHVQLLNDSFVAKLYVIKGDIHWQWGDFDSSQICYEKALTIAKRQKMEELQCTALSSIGYIQMDKGNIGKAIEYYLKCIELNGGRFLGNQQANFSYIATAYSRSKDTTNAFYYFNEALELALKSRDKYEEASIYNNIGNSYFNVGDFAKAEVSYMKALVLYKEIGSKGNYAGTLMNIAAILIKEKNYKKAIEYLNITLDICKTSEFKVRRMLCLTSLGSANLGLKKKKEADENFKEALELAKQFKSRSYMKSVLGNAAESYAAFDDHKTAYAYLELCTEYTDSLIRDENQELMAQNSAKFSLSQKQASINILKKDKELADEKMQADKKIKILLLCIVVVIVIGAYFIYNRYKLTVKQNKIIEEKQRETDLQKREIEEKQREIVDSIHYAKRIQTAMLTSENYINHYIKDYFIYYKPKDIVSGDFYWAVNHAGKFFMVTADCTGHGVPGAFMSLLNISFLNENIIEKNIIEPALILNEQRKSIIKALNPGGAEESKDGMDCILCCFDFDKMELHYAAANNSFYLVREGNLVEYKANKMPVGKSPREHESFTSHVIPLKKNDMVYTLTDGLPDQFGDPKGKKFKRKQLEEILVSIDRLSTTEQQQILSSRFESWRGDLEQVDDVCIIGVRV